MLTFARSLFVFAVASICCCVAVASEQPLPYPIMFVTQYPITGDFTAIASVFGNHRGNTELAGRGGDLYIRYPDGTLRNLTQEAGFGNAGQQGAGSIAVRDPAISWDGTKAIFSMAVGAPTQQFDAVDSFFQLYEVTGLAQGQHATVVKVPNQLTNRNNVNPIYLSDNSIVFASDNPRNGEPQLYPQLDEYEEKATVTGLWHLQPATGQPELLKFAVSGSFNPIVDSFGRLVFTRWDHFQRDQQNDAQDGSNPSGTFNYSSEAANSVPTSDRTEIFPEPRIAVAGSNVNGLVFNQFFPWMTNQDGTGEETLNHVGRHEFQSYVQRSFTNDSALVDFNEARNVLDNMLQIREDPTTPGRYVGIAAPEFATQASGQIIRVDAAPSVNASTMTVTYLNPFSDVETFDSGSVPADFTGHFRNPLPLSDGRMIAAYTPQPGPAGNDGTLTNPASHYMFRLKMLVSGASGYLEAGENLTSGISKSVSYYSPDNLVSYSGTFWELSPVEVRARPVPPLTGFQLQSPEQQAFNLQGIDPEGFRAYLRANNLALLVMRNVTTRDSADKQQPYNLHVHTNGGVQTIGSGGGKIYEIQNLQFFQADQIRGLGIINPGDAPAPGRRVIAQVMHDPTALAANAPNPTGPPGSIPISADGSVAAFVPANRAMAWHSTAPDGTPVVRERYWITFQPGEIRACDACHGVNEHNQAGQPPAENVAQSLRALLGRWDGIFRGGFDSN